MGKNRPKIGSYVDTNFQKLKDDRKFFGWAWSKNGCGQYGLYTLKLIALKNEQMG